MSGKLPGRPTKSWGLTIFFALLSAITPFVNELLEANFGITITETEVQHLATLFLGSAAIGGFNAAHKRHEKTKAVNGVPPTGGGIPPPPAPPGTAYTASTQYTVAGTGTKVAPQHVDEDGRPVPGLTDLTEDDFDDDDDELPPPKSGEN